ncbi:MAG TPA: hypothetical protein VFO63_16480 [Blastocatellia bacterium]|nr:hypothetical protein [Blastocatellia bacterium]
MVEKPNKFQAAILGGVVLGLLSSIPPINFVNICCCLWVLLGGVIAARTLIKRSPVFPVTTGEGATVGALAGVIGSLILLVISVPLGLMGIGEGMTYSFLEWMGEVSNNPQVREQMQQMIAEMQRQAATQSVGQKLVSALFAWLITAVIYIGFATLGGIIGVAMFEKRKGQPMPPMAPPGAPGYGPGFAPPGPPPGGPAPPPGEPPYGGGDRPPY